jgi:hypothetical protein
MEKTKWYEYEPNVTSALRIGFMIGIVFGALGIISSIVLSFLIFAYQRWEAIPLAISMITASGGIMAIGDIAKGIQAHAEEKNKK